MRHVDPEVLALLALGEQVALPEDSAHVSECDRCRGEIEILSRAAMIGRSTFDAGELLEAPSRVWDRISDELSLSAQTTSVSSDTAVIDDSEAEVPSDDLAHKRAARLSEGREESEFDASGDSVDALASDTDAAVSEGAIVHSLAERRRRPWIGIVAAAAAVTLVAGAGTALWATLSPAAQPTILASATLDAFPGWQDSTGEATLEQLPDGTRVIDVNLDAPATDGGYREVWLITTDATALVSLGIVEGTSGQFTVPEGLDMSSYDLVDISEEQFDGDPAHSGDSIVRGQLSTQA
ncbi:anti-sigma factor [Salinibacterium sp. SWN1162]|uniref:anti-sigma factor n=1 Tax=Salinibacterium sp. SWN1162 TaxID=2792053 RepID=UPI0018CE1AAD|nr:anti-sigma factor [Salinibacterium sp. SWN1162]MBH0010393.1 anti-sigma factor [Salinibacterium sp. SWN1162]